MRAPWDMVVSGYRVPLSRRSPQASNLDHDVPREAELSAEGDAAAHGVADFLISHWLGFKVVPPIVFVVLFVLVRSPR
jgi:hypothetical protein